MSAGASKVVDGCLTLGTDLGGLTASLQDLPRGGGRGLPQLFALARN